MTHHEQEDDQELLTEREREAIQELARAIAREAGVVRNPAEEAAETERKRLIEGGREAWKAQVDYFKHASTVSGASIVATIAVYGAFDFNTQESHYLGLAALCFFACASTALGSLALAYRGLLRLAWGDALSTSEDFRTERLRSRMRYFRTVTTVSLIAGLFFYKGRYFSM